MTDQPSPASKPENKPPEIPKPEEPREPIDPSGWKGMIDSLLRQPDDLANHESLDHLKLVARLSIVALLAMMVFGFVLGTFSYHEQLWAAPLKLVMGLVFAAIICFPSFFIFASLAGSTASVARLAALMTAMLALAGMLLLGFAPAVWIFTQGTRSFGFMGFLAVGSWLIALGFAFRFIVISLKQNKARENGPIYIWCGVFLLVTLQLTTSLRPVLGRSDEFMTNEKKFFIQHWTETAGLEVQEEKKDKK